MAKFANRVGWKKCENANRVDLFISHPRVAKTTQFEIRNPVKEPQR